MKRIEVNINAQPDWKTQYPPELVGKYLLEHEKSVRGWYGTDDLIEVKPGMFFPTPPQPSLEAFLKWSAEQETS